MSDAEDKLVENEATEMVFEKFAEDDVTYVRERTEFFFKFFWFIAAAVNFYLMWHFFGSSGLQSHFGAFVAGAITLKIYQFIPSYMDKAERAGLVKSREDMEEEEDN